jgi:hypothetical protein
VPNDIHIAWQHDGKVVFDLIPYDVVLLVPTDLNWTGGKLEPSSASRHSVVSVGQMTAVALLSSPARLELTYEDRGSRIATYGPNAVLWVPWWNGKTARGGGPLTYAGATNPQTYWVPINKLTSAALVVAPTTWPSTPG